MLIAQGTGTTGHVDVWDNADAIVADRAADASIAIGSQPLGLARAADRLFVVTNGSLNALLAYDGLATLGTSSTASASIGVTAFGGFPPTNVYGAAYTGGHLWITSSESQGATRLFLNAATLTSASTSQALFTHMWGQIYSAAYDSTHDRLFGGQVSGAGVIAWNAATTKTGETNAHDFVLQQTNVYAMVVCGDALYRGANVAPFLSIWRVLAGLTATTTPTVTVGAGYGLSNVNQLDCTNGKLVVTNNGAPSNYSVLIYANPATIVSTTAASSTVTDAAMVLPKKSYLDRNDTLYVLMSDSLLIFTNASTTPTLKVKLDAGIASAKDFLVIE